jgi:DNA-binding transcriptional LysR family regulator
MAPDLNAVAVFLKVVELSSFRAAAQALRLPRSTVSFKVSQLEDQLGVRLLERTTRALRLTDAGRAYRLQVAPALEMVDQAGRAVADLEAEPTGTLRLTAPMEMGQALMGDVLGEYLHRCPGVKLDVVLTDRRVDLIEEGFDLALRAGTLPDSTLMARRLGNPTRMLLVASPDYLHRRSPPRHPTDLARHDCMVMSGARTPTTWSFLVGGKRLDVDVDPRLAVNSHLVLRDLAVAGQGIARLPESFTVTARRSGRLRAVLERYAGAPLAWHAIYPSARHLSAKLRILLDLFETRLRGRAHLELCAGYPSDSVDQRR